MFVFLYLLLNVAIVFFTLLLFNIADTQRKTHAQKLEKMVRKNSAVMEQCGKNDDYRLPVKTISGLKHYIGMEAFFEELNKLDSEKRRKIMLDNSDKIIDQLRKEKQPTIHAYFAYMLKDIGIVGHNGGGYGTLMIKFLDDNSVFARENALKAIYSFGDPRLVELAFLLLSEKAMTHNEKLLSDGLLSFPGDKDALASLLMKDFDSLLECYRHSAINFLSFARIDKYDDMLIKRAMRSETSIDTICCITRKINKVQSERNLRYLKDITARFKEGSDWEPVSVAVMGLGHYPEDRSVKDILKRELLSRNWYIRKHSAESLALIGVTEQDLEDIRSKNDRFANDAIHYAMTRLEHV